MENNLVNKTHEVLFEENEDQHKLRINYGFHKMGDQEPYFSITAEEFILVKRNKKDPGRWVWVSCGCLHDEIRKRAPELAGLIRWHLCFVETGPLHYIANGMFWFERSLLNNPAPLYAGDTCASGDKALGFFKDHVIYGASKEYDPIDCILEHRAAPVQGDMLALIRQWMTERLPSVMVQFHKDMKEFGVEE